MPLLIDAFNVLHTAGVLPPELAGLDLARLIALIQISRYQRQSTTLVCDGSPQDERAPKHLPGNVQVRYSGRGRIADDVIAKLIDASSSPRRLIVVSSDHAVIRSARRRGCKSFRSQQFLEQLLADVFRMRRGSDNAMRPRGVASSEVDDWLATFRVDSNLVGELESALPEPILKKPTKAPPSKAGRSSRKVKQASKPPRSRPPRQPDTGLPSSLIEQAQRIWERHQRELEQE